MCRGKFDSQEVETCSLMLFGQVDSSSQGCNQDLPSASAWSRIRLLLNEGLGGSFWVWFSLKYTCFGCWEQLYSWIWSFSDSTRRNSHWYWCCCGHPSRRHGLWYSWRLTYSNAFAFHTQVSTQSILLGAESEQAIVSKSLHLVWRQMNLSDELRI